MANRTHIIGLDKPTAPPLGGVANPQHVLREQALTHEKHRLESIAEMLALAGLMTVKKVLAGREVVTVRGAVYQFGQGVRVHGTIAAHCLPGQLRFNDVAIHQMSEWKADLIKERGMKPLALGSKLRNLFGRTDVVDGSVNDLDSWVEKMSNERGLKFLFARSVQQLMERVLLQKPTTCRTLSEIVEDKFEHYRFGATYVCEERLDSLIHTAMPAKPDKNDSNRKFIVEQYLSVLRDVSFIPEAIKPAGFRGLIKDVLEQGPQMVSSGSDKIQV